MATDRDRWLGTLIVLAAASLFASLGVLSRIAYDAGLDPLAWVAWRAGIGAIGLGVAVAAWRGRGALAAELRRTSRTTRWWLLLGIATSAGLNLAIFLAFERTTIALALLGFYTYPAMVAAAGALLGREPLDRTRAVALVLAMAGMAGVVLGGLDPAAGVRLDALGIGLALAAALSQTIFMTFSRGYATVPTEHAMTVLLGGSAVIAAGVSVAADGLDGLLVPLGSGGLLLLLLAVGLFAAALPSFLFLTGIRRIGSVRTGILMLFEPLVGVALAAVVLAEGLTPLQATGGATILLAALLVQRGSSRVREATAIAPVPGGP
ncbi:MAG TPA: DMT family transporter [Candidatus Deferrimicrobiaceae bacterium]|nr:DMT family transporter [Candidatus Deferrimicrobiaceae bacterium]